MDAEHTALLRRIETAFANVPRPSRITKRVARALDDDHGLTTEERRASLYAEDSEQHWRDLTDDDLAVYQDVVLWLDEEGCLFYFPAFMAHNLDDQDPFAWSSANFIATTFRSYPERLSLFNEEQRQCVAQFVVFAERNESERRADLDAVRAHLEGRVSPADPDKVARILTLAETRQAGQARADENKCE